MTAGSGPAADEPVHVLADTVAFRRLGFGAQCSTCGAVVAGEGSQAAHRRYHAALAQLGWNDLEGRGGR